MRIATLLLQAQDALLFEAAEHLPSGTDDDLIEVDLDIRRDLLEVVLRCSVAHLTRAPIHPDTLRLLRDQYAPETVVDALRALRTAAKLKVGAMSAEEIEEFDRGLSAVARLVDRTFTPTSTADALAGFGASEFDTDDDPFDHAPRPTLLLALSDFGDLGLQQEAPHEEQRPPPVSALLRVRAHSATAARRMHRALESALATMDLARIPAAPDEALVGSLGDVGDGVSQLVRLAASLFGPSQEFEGAAVKAALVVVDDHRDDPERTTPGHPIDPQDLITEAVVRAGALIERPGLLQLDDAAWEAGGPALAEVPGAPRHVDPRAAFRNDRWELSAFLSRPPFLGREKDVALIAAHFSGDNVHPVEESDPYFRTDAANSTYHDDDDDGDATGEEADAQDDRLDATDAPRLLLLHGPDGIGKTSVVRSALASIEMTDARAPILWGAADPLQPTPYAAVVGMVRALAGAPSGDVKAFEKLTRLLEGLAPFLEDDASMEFLALAPVLAYLIGAVDDDETVNVAAQVGEMSPRALRVSIRRAVLLLALSLKVRGGHDRLVVIVPGAAALDAPSRDLLGYLGRHLRDALRIVFLTRKRLRLPRAFEQGFTVTRHEVKPLSPDESRSVLVSILDDDVPGFEPVIDKASGSPLALHHILRFAVEGGFITQHEGTWDLSRVKPRLLPGRIERVLDGRVQRLPDVARRVLGYCALLGHSVLPSAVEYVGVRDGMAREDIAAALSQLLQTSFLVQSGHRPAAPAFRERGQATSEAFVVFEHPLLRGAAERSVPEEERPRLHGLAAEAHVALLGAGTYAVAAKLARHHKLAGNRKEALEHLLIAVRRAVRLDNRAGAMAMAKDGLSLAFETEPDTRFQFQLELEKAQELAHDRDGQKASLKELVRLAHRTQTPRRQGQALQRVARFNVFGGDHEKAVDACVKALERFRAAEDARGQAQTLRVLALARFEMRELEAAVSALNAARALVDESDARALGIIEHQLGVLCLEAGVPLDALEHLLAAHAHRQRVGDISGAAACLDAISDVYVRTGRPHTAIQILQEAVATQHRIGDEAGRAGSTKNLAEVSALVGDTQAAVAGAQTARAIARTLNLERLERSATIVSARAALLGGDPKVAEQLIESVRRRAQDNGDPFAAMEAALVSGRAKWMRARDAKNRSARDRLLKTALGRAKDATELGETHGYASGQVLGMALSGDVLVELGDPGAALSYAQRAAELFDERATTGLSIEEIRGAHARVLLALGDEEEARAVLLRAVRDLASRAERIPQENRARFWAPPMRSEIRDTYLEVSGDDPESLSTLAMLGDSLRESFGDTAL